MQNYNSLNSSPAFFTDWRAVWLESHRKRENGRSSVTQGSKQMPQRGFGQSVLCKNWICLWCQCGKGFSCGIKQHKWYIFIIIARKCCSCWTVLISPRDCHHHCCQRNQPSRGPCQRTGTFPNLCIPVSLTWRPREHGNSRGSQGASETWVQVVWHESSDF